MLAPAALGLLILVVLAYRMWWSADVRLWALTDRNSPRDPLTVPEKTSASSAAAYSKTDEGELLIWERLSFMALTLIIPQEPDLEASKHRFLRRRHRTFAAVGLLG